MVITERELKIYERVKVDGALQHMVAAEFELTQSRISQIVKAVEVWNSEAVLPTDPRTESLEELPRQERLYATFRLHRDRLEKNYARAMRAWEESREGQITEKEIRTKDGVKDEFTRKSSPGNPRFLDQAIRFSEKLLKMEGFSGRGEVHVGCHNRLHEEPTPTAEFTASANEIYDKLFNEMMADVQARIDKAQAAEAAAAAAIAAATAVQAASLAGEKPQRVGTEVSEAREAVSSPPNCEQASSEQNSSEQNSSEQAATPAETMPVSQLSVATKEAWAQAAVADAWTVDPTDEPDFGNHDVAVDADVAESDEAESDEAESEELMEDADLEAIAERLALAVLPYELRKVGSSERAEPDANNRLWKARVVESQMDEIRQEKRPEVVVDASNKSLISEGAEGEGREAVEMPEGRPGAGGERREAGDQQVQLPKRRQFQVGPYPDEEQNDGMVFRSRAR
jgi:hypothetical protein